MNSAMKLLYKATQRDSILDIYGSNAVYARQYDIRGEKLKSFSCSMTKEQRDWFDEFCIADEKTREIINFERFCEGFHFGAQLMAELVQNKEALLK